MTDKNRRQRLRFRSWHRGTREMDLLMGSFADAHLEALSGQGLDQFEHILTLSDPDLYNWITGAEAAPSGEQTEVMELLCRHQYAKKAL